MATALDTASVSGAVEIVSIDGGGDNELPHLSRQEVEQAIISLTKYERVTLKKVARDQAAKTKGVFTADELLQEAFSRALSGKRSWLRKYDAVTFFAGRCGVMRSIAYSARASQDAAIVTQYHDETHYNLSFACRAAEFVVTSNMGFGDILCLFDDDQIARNMFLGMVAGLRGEELREQTGLEQKEFDSKLRKIRRRIERGQKDGKL